MYNTNPLTPYTDLHDNGVMRAHNNNKYQRSVAVKEEQDRYRRCKTILREELSEMLSNILLGERIPSDIVNTKTKSVIVRANHKITKPMLRKVACAYEHIKVGFRPFSDRLREIVSCCKKRRAELEMDHRRRMDLLENSNRLDLMTNYEKGVFLEKWIAELLKGATRCDIDDVQTTRHNHRVDVVLTRKKDRETLTLEVKFSKLGPQSHCPSSRRWTWGPFRGADGKKSYDRLILVGEPDLRYKERYKDQSVHAQYVLFDIPAKRASEISYSGGGRHLNSNPDGVQKWKHICHELYNQWQVSEADLLKRFELWGKGGKCPSGIPPEHWWKREIVMDRAAGG